MAAVSPAKASFFWRPDFHRGIDNSVCGAPDYAAGESLRGFLLADQAQLPCLSLSEGPRFVWRLVGRL
jgi:hypothetical protein